MPSWSAFSVGSLVSLSPGLGAHDEQRSLRALIYDDDAILIKSETWFRTTVNGLESELHHRHESTP